MGDSLIEIHHVTDSRGSALKAAVAYNNFLNHLHNSESEVHKFSSSTSQKRFKSALKEVQSNSDQQLEASLRRRNTWQAASQKERSCIKHCPPKTTQHVSETLDETLLKLSPSDYSRSCFFKGETSCPRVTSTSIKLIDQPLQTAFAAAEADLIKSQTLQLKQQQEEILNTQKAFSRSKIAIEAKKSEAREATLFDDIKEIVPKYAPSFINTRSNRLSLDEQDLFNSIEYLSKL
ncbi:hypothetical protein RCL1_007822 [Eukaryota sp. TZLM3-RCL]